MSWDDTLTILIRDSSTNRLAMLGHEARSLLDYVESSFKDRSDLQDVVAAMVSILTNPVLERTPGAWSVIAEGLGRLHGQVIKSLQAPPPPQDPTPSLRALQEAQVER